METYAVVILQILQVLILVLTQRLSDLRVFDDIQDGLSFLLQAFVGRDGVFALAREF